MSKLYLENKHSSFSWGDCAVLIWLFVAVESWKAEPLYNPTNKKVGGKKNALYRTLEIE